MGTFSGFKSVPAAASRANIHANMRASHYVVFEAGCYTALVKSRLSVCYHRAVVLVSKISGRSCELVAPFVPVNMYR